MYDPTLGRFIQRDPIGLAAGGSNLYAYGRSAPTNVTDPTGLAGTAGALRVIVDWHKVSWSKEFTVKMGKCCYKIELSYEYEERVVERQVGGAFVPFLQWRNLKYTDYRLGEQVACTGKEVGELARPNIWHVWKPPIAKEGEGRISPPPAAPAFGEHVIGGEAPGGVYSTGHWESFEVESLDTIEEELRSRYPGSGYWKTGNYEVIHENGKVIVKVFVAMLGD